jgi:hypothetical protein
MYTNSRLGKSAASGPTISMPDLHQLADAGCPLGLAAIEESHLRIAGQWGNCRDKIRGRPVHRQRCYDERSNPFGRATSSSSMTSGARPARHGGADQRRWYSRLVCKRK